MLVFRSGSLLVLLHGLGCSKSSAIRLEVIATSFLLSSIMLCLNRFEWRPERLTSNRNVNMKLLDRVKDEQKWTYIETTCLRSNTFGTDNSDSFDCLSQSSSFGSFCICSFQLGCSCCCVGKSLYMPRMTLCQSECQCMVSGRLRIRCFWLDRRPLNSSISLNYKKNQILK